MSETETQPQPDPTGSKDGQGAADHDEPYQFRSPSTRWPFPFTERQYAKLLVLKSKVQDETKEDDTCHTDGLSQWTSPATDETNTEG